VQNYDIHPYRLYTGVYYAVGDLFDRSSVGQFYTIQRKENTTLSKLKNQTANSVVLSDEMELTDEQLQIVAGAQGDDHDHGGEHHDWDGDGDRHRWWGWHGHRGWGDDGDRPWGWHRHPHYVWSPYYQQWVLSYD
jgi:hypothetical protein